MLRYDLTLLLRNPILTKWATLELLTLELLLLTQLRTTRSTTLTTSGWDLFSFSRYFFDIFPPISFIVIFRQSCSTFLVTFGKLSKVERLDFVQKT